MNHYIGYEHVLDDSGKPWMTNRWHPMPIPKGIEPSAYWPVTLPGTYWLVQAPLPPVPVVKTQDQVEDYAAYDKWLEGGHPLILSEAFCAGARYARQQIAPERIV